MQKEKENKTYKNDILNCFQPQNFYDPNIFKLNTGKLTFLMHSF